MRIMKLLFILALIIFFVTFAVTSKTDCGACDYSVKGLVNDYHAACIEVGPIDVENINFTLIDYTLPNSYLKT